MLDGIPWYVWVWDEAQQIYTLYKLVKQVIDAVNNIIDIVKKIIDIVKKISCVDGDMLLPTPVDSVQKKVSSLQLGDIILGATNLNMEKTNCEVLAVFPAYKNLNSTTFGGFTSDHLVVSDSSRKDAEANGNTDNVIVTVAGSSGERKTSSLYTLFTDCDATYNIKGELFTPISAAFCPQMPWSDYIQVMAAIRRVYMKTGNFWFNLDVYYDNPADPEYPSFMSALPELCQETLQCSKYQKCDNFEKVSSNFIQSHLYPAEVKIVKKAFPSIGNPDVSLQGTLSATVSGRLDGQIPGPYKYVIIAGALVVVLIITFLVLYFWRSSTANKKDIEEMMNVKEKDIELVPIPDVSAAIKTSENDSNGK